MPRSFIVSLLLLIVTGCSFLATQQWDKRFGPSSPINRASAASFAVSNTDVPDYLREVKPIIDNRCVVCHGCYDAPCQLKLESMTGLERGANKERVYDGARLLAANLTRLYEDADSTEQWRLKGFFPVLNEREQSEPANQQASVLMQMLELKQRHPLPSNGPLPDSQFDFALDRSQSCPSIEEFDTYAADFPLAGMPYGLPGLSQEEHQTLTNWITSGARGFDLSAHFSPELSAQIADWETFLNGNDNKNQLASRYIFEHLYLANLYFDDGAERQFFRLVRSATPPGQPVERISSRRPFDDPGVKRVYYRLIFYPETIVAKNHMPYALNKARLSKWREWFLGSDYAVPSLPSYDLATSANPFKTFQHIPPKIRYRFMLEESQYTIMGFIKGPVCRGQTALNVINDQFWVFFVDPDYPDIAEFADFLANNSDNLDLPAERDSSAGALAGWLTYSEKQQAYLKAQDQLIKTKLARYKGPDINMVWQGDGDNPNAALTVFRHFDNATVAQGLIGNDPKTAWVITYPLLERIHYLLVAGFDVYGNVGHQLLTRTYMDFLRMEGEQTFLSLLPKETAHQELAYWYRGAEDIVPTYFKGAGLSEQWQTQLTFSSDNPKAELYQKLKSHLDGVRNLNHDIDTNLHLSPTTQRHLLGLQNQRGKHLQWLPDSSLLIIEQEPPLRPAVISLLHNKAHQNITSLLLEGRNRLVDEDTLTVANGILTTYPNALFKLGNEALPGFNQRVARLQSAQDYQALVDAFGVRRNNPNFWALSDELHKLYRQQEPISYGLLDYNRLENR
ncbi:fatty acid cis/trans isomerase [Simiduia curdlanivorans]|uniref:Fatty acid cis/trans isomerase n=1 Tax=Simiduia curdlanivorans TaxID=1492769 RepID=A0ABV8V4K1_9GAMM|nr:fatty acid cis/trans isomerase [Simiduia curdlanivorans]MDN3637260.1 fatty acid cis/trans isomerase [Simiduia curdlanivorans]